ncbi:MAG TPA: hypothetical protein VG188_00635, partial [Solirubrobacteraceae bacterium]|nr:hypothetical protein [Solirubrobacteraceae bacterium]
MRTISASRLLGADRAPLHAPIRPLRDDDVLVARPLPAPEPRERAVSLLCEDEPTRRRLLDMEVHLRSARLAAFAMLLAGALILAPWLGFSPTLAVVASFVAFGIAGARMPRSTRPEYWFMGAWIFSQG